MWPLNTEIEMINDKFYSDELFLSTIFLTDNEKNSSTGLIISKFEKTLDSIKNYFVLSREFFKRASSISIKFNKKPNGLNCPEIGSFIDVPLDLGKISSFCRFENDLAILPIDHSFLNLQCAFFVPLQFEELTKYPHMEFNEHMVIFVGYSHNTLDPFDHVPVIRYGRIMICRGEQAESHEYFICGQIFPESIGSPLFIMVEKQFYLLGIISKLNESNRIINYYSIGTLQDISTIKTIMF